MKINTVFNFDEKIKLLFFLGMLYFTINLIGVPMTYKLITIGPLIGPGGLSVLPLVFLVEDMIVELYGYKVSRFLLWLILFSTMIFSIACVAIIHLPSPDYWHLEDSYKTVFDPILKSGPVAVVAIFCGRFINIILMTKGKILFNGRYFWLRSIFATLIGSSFALTVFFILSFWGRVPFSVIETLFISDMVVRLSYTIIGGIPLTFIIGYLKMKFGIDVYDEHLNFNPFSFDTKNS